MKTLKSNFFLLFVFILSASILFDSASHSSKCLTDKFEEIIPSLSSESSFVIFAKYIKNIESKYQEWKILQPKIDKSSVFIPSIGFNSKIIAFLHLFQLF